MANVIPPDNRAGGQTGHIADHNNIADVLTAMQTQLGALPTFQTGTATLVAGTVTVPNTSVQAGWFIHLSRMLPFSGTAGVLAWSINPGVSFTITSTLNTDTGTIAWMLVS